MFGSSKNIAMGNRMSITGGSHIRRARIITKVFPRSYLVKFDVVEKPKERNPACVRAWKVKKCMPLSSSPTPSAFPDTITSRGHDQKKKRVGTVSSEDIAQVMLPVLKSMSSLTQNKWNAIAQAVKNLFL
jgi:hypothetical protein